MLSIQKIRDVDYYDKLAEVDDYYLDARTAPGRWYGRGAETLGLQGDVASPVFRNIFAGFAPDGSALVQNAGRLRRGDQPGHSPGWDLTFSAPKSVSLLWALGAAETQAAVASAHEAAVRLTLAIAEEQCGFTRRGKGGRYVERCDLVVAAFQHGTSRELDPSLHTHCLIANVGLCQDGQSRALLSQQFYRWKMTLGKLYQAELAYQLHTQGFQTASTADAFEVDGIPAELCKHFSKRRSQIEKSLRAKGLIGTAKASEAAALNTRRKKQTLPPESLRSAWHEEAITQGFPAERIDQLERVPPSHEPGPGLVDVYADRSIEKLTESQAHFTAQSLLRALGPMAIDERLSASTLLAGVNRYLNVGEHVIHLGELDLERQYTTTDVLGRETELLDAAHKLNHDQSITVHDEIVSGVLKRHAGVAARDEQADALRYLLATGNLKLLSGMPGTGKTFVLDAARDAFEAAGYRVLGTAIAGKAVRELSEKAHLQADTAAKLLIDFAKTPMDEAAHHARQLMRAAAKRSTTPFERYALDRRTILVIDEAGMLDSAIGCALICEAERRGAKVILVGDPDQLPPIGAGAPFSALLSRYDHRTLTDIKRQADAADIEAIKHVAAGDVAAMLQSYRERDRLSISVDKRHAIERLVADWSARGGAAEPAKHAIFVSTNADRHAVNDACQEERIRQSRPTGPTLSLRAKETRGGVAQVISETFYVGDPVVCLKRSRALGIENGTTGIVTNVDSRGRFITIAVAELGGHREVILPLADYPHFTRGFAMSTHKGQGQTVENSYVLVGGSMQAKELTYTQISRAKGATMLYATSQDAGRNTEGLEAMIGRSRAKRMAHDLLSTDESIEPKRPPLEPPRPIRIPL